MLYTTCRSTMASGRLARLALLKARVMPCSTPSAMCTSSRRLLHTTQVFDGPTVLPDEFLEQARKEGEEKEKVRREADKEEEIKNQLLDASLKQAIEKFAIKSWHLGIRKSGMGRFLFLIQVMMHGWSKDAIRAAAVELGRPSVVAGLVKVNLNFF